MAMAAEQRAGVRALLDALAHGDPNDTVALGELAALDQHAFGVLLFIAALPAFIPIPIGGAISGPLAMLVGAQLLIGRRRAWMPGFIARRGPHRRTIAAFNRRLSPWLARMESMIRPRLPRIVDHGPAMLLTGALLMLLGLLLSLPIPLTNYLFGVLLLLFALALLERDGLLMLVAWGAGIAAVVVFGMLSGNLAAMTLPWVFGSGGATPAGG
jgi:hypothetical protein